MGKIPPTHETTEARANTLSLSKIGTEGNSTVFGMFWMIGTYLWKRQEGGRKDCEPSSRCHNSRHHGRRNVLTMWAHSRRTGPANCHNKIQTLRRRYPSRMHCCRNSRATNRCNNADERIVYSVPLPQQLSSGTPQRHCADAAAATAGPNDAATPLVGRTEVPEQIRE